MSEETTTPPAAPETPAAPAPPRIKEQRSHGSGFGGGSIQTRVRELAQGEALPDGAQVTEEPVSDWQATG